MRAYKRKFLSLLVLFILGAVWMTWTAGISDSTPELKLLFLGIGVGTLSTGAGATYYAYSTVIWVWEGFKLPRTRLPVANPMNRVGTASPLGEARFAKSREVHVALLGRGGDFAPSRFRD
jgi:hypothetical protein